MRQEQLNSANSRSYDNLTQKLSSFYKKEQLTLRLIVGGNVSNCDSLSKGLIMAVMRRKTAVLVGP